MDGWRTHHMQRGLSTSSTAAADANGVSGDANAPLPAGTEQLGRGQPPDSPREVIASRSPLPADFEEASDDDDDFVVLSDDAEVGLGGRGGSGEEDLIMSRTGVAPQPQPDLVAQYLSPVRAQLRPELRAPFACQSAQMLDQ